MLEAGPPWDSGKDAAMFAWNYDSPRRGAATAGGPSASSTPASAAGTSRASRTPSAPGSQFNWFRGRMLGGRTNHWGRISLRFGPEDFKAPQPRRPRRRLADRLRGPEAVLRPARRAGRDLRHRTRGSRTSRTASSCRRRSRAATSSLIQKACEGLGIPCIPSRLSILTQPLGDRPGLPLLRPVRPRLRDPLQLLDRRRCCCRRRSPRPADDRHRRDGARGDDRRRGPRRPASPTSTPPPAQDRHVRARVVVLAASACESARAPAQLALEPRTRTGLANSSGARRQVPHRHRRARACGGYIPALDEPAAAQRGRRRRHARLHAVVARQPEARLPARLPHRARRRAAACPATASCGGIEQVQRRRLRQGAEGRLPALLRRLRRLRRPRRDDPEREELLRDRPRGGGPVGHPGAALPLEVVRPRARRRRGTCSETFRAIIEEMGGKVLERNRSRPPTQADEDGIATGGEIIHEVGTTRMGDEPAHVGAQRVVPGARREEPVRGRRRAVRHATPHKNPTWTILALAMRTAEHIADEREEGEPVSDRADRSERRPGAPSRPIDRPGGPARRGRRYPLAARARPLARAAAGGAGARRTGARRGRGEGKPPRAEVLHRRTSGRPCASCRDLVIPTDERSGSATDALVPEFIDFILDDPLAEPRERESAADAGAGRARLARPRVPRRGSRRRFVDCAAGERTSRPRRHRLAGEGRGRRWGRGRRSSPSSATSWPRASGRAGWASRTCGTLGNTFVAEWKGCPPEVLAKIGLGER